MCAHPLPTGGAPVSARARLKARTARAWSWLVDGLAALGTVLIGALMALIAADIAVRNTFGFSLPMVSEAGALTLVLIVYLQLATALRHDRLARAEMLYLPVRERLPRLGAALGAAFDLVGAVMLAIIARATLTILEREIARGEFIGVPGIVTLPTWPFRAVILFGLTVAALQCVLNVLNGIRAALAPRSTGDKRTAP